MSRIFILSLLAIMLFQTFSKVLIILDYQANKEYIMEFLCINREKPELECEGKCQLKKELEKHDHAKKQAGEHQLPEIQINLFLQQGFQFQLVVPQAASLENLTLEAGATTQASHTFFHPPQV